MANLWPDRPAPWVMGVLNVTPDSFSDGGRYLDPESAISHAHKLIQEGADIIDVGGESSRPGADLVPVEEQVRRVVGVIRAVRASWQGPISIDTTRAEVVAAALDAGANWVNDISALRDDPDMALLVGSRGCVAVLMHMQGTPRTMQAAPFYRDVVSEVKQFLLERAAFAERHAIRHDHIIIDPGIGFGKTLAHNLELLRNLPDLVAPGYPVLVGVSRKSFIGQLTDAPVGGRLEGSLAAAVLAVRAGARIVRVHDVAATRRALTVAAAVIAGCPPA